MDAKGFEYKFLGGGDTGGGSGFLEIDSDQQIYGDTFGPIPNNPHSGLGLPQMGGSNTMLYVAGGAVVLVLIILLMRR